MTRFNIKSFHKNSLLFDILEILKEVVNYMDDGDEPILSNVKTTIIKIEEEIKNDARLSKIQSL